MRFQLGLANFDQLTATGDDINFTWLNLGMSALKKLPARSKEGYSWGCVRST